MFPAAQVCRRRGATERVVRSHSSCDSATERDAAGHERRRRLVACGPAPLPQVGPHESGGCAGPRRTKRLSHPMTGERVGCGAGDAAGAGSSRQPPISASRTREKPPNGSGVHRRGHARDERPIHEVVSRVAASGATPSWAAAVHPLLRLSGQPEAKALRPAGRANGARRQLHRTRCRPRTHMRESSTKGRVRNGATIRPRDPEPAESRSATRTCSIPG
jgi:hypothetical protein